jgi:AcrR family transcriptional regulator
VTYLPAGERRRAIIDAAIEVIAEEGLAKATTRRIAERAGTPRATIHYCFRDKNELILLILERARATMLAAFDHLEPGAGFEAALRATVAAYWQWIRDDPGLHLALLELTMWVIRNRSVVAPDGGDVWALVNAPLGGDLIETTLTDAARSDGTHPAVPVHDLARFLIHRMDGLVLEYAETQDAAGCDRQAALLADALVALA